MADRAASALAGRLANAALLGVLALLLFASARLLADRYAGYEADGGYFSSDDLYAVEMADHVLANGPDLAGWHMPLAPYLFPDIAAVLAIRPFVSDLAVLFFLYCLLFCSALAAVTAWLARECGLSRVRAAAVGLAAVASLLALFSGGAYLGGGVLLYRACSHAGAVLVGLLALAFVLRGLRRGFGWVSGPLFVTATALGVLSDQLLVVQFLAPICLALFYLVVLRAVPLRRAATPVLLLAAAGLLAQVLKWQLPKLGIVLLGFSRPARLANLPGSLPAAWEFATTILPACVEGRPVLKWVLVLHAGVALFLTLRLPALLTRRGTGRSEEAIPEAGVDAARARLAFAAATLLIPACNLGAVALAAANGLVTNEIRYILALSFVPFVSLGVLLSSFPRDRRQVLGTAYLVVAFLFTVGTVVARGPSLGSRPLRQPYPELARAIDELVREGGHTHGLAEFWSARHLRYLCKSGVCINTALPDGRPWLHSTGPDTYLFPDRHALPTPTYTFVVFRHPPHEDMGLDRKLLAVQFGPPSEKRVVGKHEIWLYRRLNNRYLDLFLTSAAEKRYRAQYEVIPPSSPRRLGRPKPVMTPWNAKGNLLLHPRSPVEVCFTGRARGELVDVGADYDDEYALAFFYGEELVGELHVPAIPWTGCAYGLPGIQSRLLPVPAALARRGWTRVVIIPAGGDDKFSVGHFLVLRSREGTTRQGSLLP